MKNQQNEIKNLIINHKKKNCNDVTEYVQSLQHVANVNATAFGQFKITDDIAIEILARFVIFNPFFNDLINVMNFSKSFKVSYKNEISKIKYQLPTDECRKFLQNNGILNIPPENY